MTIPESHPFNEGKVHVERRNVPPSLKHQQGGTHYKELAIEPAEYIIRNELPFAEGNIVKYITRHRKKGGADDIRKVIHYAEMILDMVYGETPSQRHAQHDEGNDQLLEHGLLV